MYTIVYIVNNGIIPNSILRLSIVTGYGGLEFNEPNMIKSRIEHYQPWIVPIRRIQVWGWELSALDSSHTKDSSLGLGTISLG